MPATLVTFLVASIALLLVPGPSVLYVVARSVSQGRWAGLVSVAGGALGNLMHVAAATVGLSALLASSALAFSVVKYAGAAYLIYLGVRTLLSDAPVDPILAAPQPPRRVFAQAVLVYALNPKTALFFLAFLPQFADPARGAIGPQLFLLGCLFVLLALCTDSGYALLAGGLGQRLRHRAPRALAALVLGRHLSRSGSDHGVERRRADVRPRSRPCPTLPSRWTWPSDAIATPSIMNQRTGRRQS